MRLNKFIAHHSSYSRREADELIFKQRIKVNGKMIDNPATDVTDNDVVLLNSKRLQKKKNYTILIYNKSKGELVTKKDPEGRKTIYHSINSKYRGFIPVGRLDYASEGLLILTDAVDIADILMRSELDREYKIKITGYVTPQMEEGMKEGLFLQDATAGAHEKSRIKSMEFAPFVSYKIIKNQSNFSILKVVLKEGKNRELRRFFAHFKADVMDLKRVRYGELSLNALPEGKTRFLSTQEYDWVRSFVSEEKSKKV